MFDADGLDRLLPRHNAHAALEIEWDIHPSRRVLSRGKEVSVAGTVHDISLEGALIQVLDDRERADGAEVRIRVLGVGGIALVRHTREAPDDGGVLHGIQFGGGPKFKQAISDAVAAFRENDDRLRSQWEDTR